MATNKYVRFDWAAKKILHDKANFSILEGLVTILLNEPVHIIELLESEYDLYLTGNIDIKATDSEGKFILIRIRSSRILQYIEHIHSHYYKGAHPTKTPICDLGQFNKVYIICLLYFGLGVGDDYIYRGLSVFEGQTRHDVLHVSDKEESFIGKDFYKDVFPEYYLVRINAFDKIAENHLEEWIEYLKTGDIADDTTAPGLQEAKKKLEYMAMSKSEKLAYDEHINAVMIQNDVLSTAIKEGRAEGRKEGIKEGIKEGRAEATLENARQMIAAGIDRSMIIAALHLTEDQIRQI